MARVYLAATLGDLAAWHAAGEIPAAATRLEAPDEDEASEYAALMGAADASAALSGGTGRRVVVVAEPDAAEGPVAMRDVVAVHVDTAEDADPDDDLAWFAPQEIPDLI